MRGVSGADRTLTIRKALLSFLDHLQRAVTRLGVDAVALPGAGYGWSSGHHRFFVYPESWSSAAGFDFCDLTDRLATDTITTAVMRHLGEPRPAADFPATTAAFDKILDSRIRKGSESYSLKAVLQQRLLEPIWKARTRLEEGKPIEEGTAISAILFGPPGTSKTSISPGRRRVAVAVPTDRQRRPRSAWYGWATWERRPCRSLPVTI
jgi:hypothetical protein